MPAPKTIYFGIDKGTEWNDWVRVVNISNNRAKILAVVRDSRGNTVWSGERDLNPYQTWVIPAEQGGADRRGDMSLEVRSDGSIVGERHLHHGKDSMAFPGASMEVGGDCCGILLRYNNTDSHYWFGISAAWTKYAAGTANETREQELIPVKINVGIKMKNKTVCVIQNLKLHDDC